MTETLAGDGALNSVLAQSPEKSTQIAVLKLLGKMRPLTPL